MRKELLIVAVISLSISLLSLFQTWMYFFHTPAGTVYPFVHNYVPDYYWYLSLMRQGWEGNLLATTRYTSEIFAPQFVNTFFPVLGIIARIFFLPLPIMYTLVRIAGGAGLLLSAYLLARELGFSKSEKIFSLFLVVFGVPVWVLNNGSVQMAGEFWTGFDPIFRISWLPHHLFANICLIWSLIFFSRAIHARQFRNSFVGGIWAIGSIWINPAGLFVLGASWTIVIFYCFLKKKLSPSRLIYGFFLVLPIVGLYLVQNSVFPWTAFRDWERYVFYPVDAREFLMILGLPGFLAIPGFFLALHKKQPLYWAILVWFIVPFVGLVIFTRFLPISNGRYIQSAAYIPASLLAALAVSKILSLVKRQGSRVLFVMIILLIGLYSLPTWQRSLRRQSQYARENAGNQLVYVPKSTIDALAWLSAHEKEHTVMMSPGEVSPLVPVYTSLRVVHGHPTFTLDSPRKADLVLRFYSTMSDSERVASIGSQHVSYIWIPKFLPALLSDWKGRMGFREVYSNTAVTILKK